MNRMISEVILLLLVSAPRLAEQPLLGFNHWNGFLTTGFEREREQPPQLNT